MLTVVFEVEKAFSNCNFPEDIWILPDGSGTESAARSCTRCNTPVVSFCRRPDRFLLISQLLVVLRKLVSLIEGREPDDDEPETTAPLPPLETYPAFSVTVHEIFPLLGEEFQCTGKSVSSLDGSVNIFIRKLGIKQGSFPSQF